MTGIVDQLVYVPTLTFRSQPISKMRSSFYSATFDGVLLGLKAVSNYLMASPEIPSMTKYKDWGVMLAVFGVAVIEPFKANIFPTDRLLEPELFARVTSLGVGAKTVYSNAMRLFDIWS